MPSITGLVQRLYMDTSGTQTSTACVFVGPSPSNTELLLLRRDVSDPSNASAMKTSILNALGQALAGRREVVVTFVTNDRTLPDLAGIRIVQLRDHLSKR